MYDLCVIGGGIVGLGTAMAAIERFPGARVLVLEREKALAAHQTSHNSGVIHAGVYYKPGSLKAELCKKGERATKEFCERHDIPFRTPGKLIVATNEMENLRLVKLEENARKNNVAIRKIALEELRELEPNISGVAALRVETTGIVDYACVAAAMGRLIVESGGKIIYGVEVERLEERGEYVRAVAREQQWECRKAIACAGLQSDRLARRSGAKVDFQIVPFQGKYFRIRPEKQNIVSHLIYPVPDPALPFLGVHLTPMIDGSLTVGPNAVLGFSREKYRAFGINIADTASYLMYPGFWRLMSRHARSAASELKSSLSKQSYLERCRKYYPGLELEDLLPFRPGIRAQAVSPSGTLIEDFSFVNTRNVLHVCNAPSPAATCAIPIGRMIFDRMQS